MGTIKHGLLAASCLSLAAVSAPSQAFAQNSDPDNKAVLEEIIVTAQKRSESLQDTAAAITAVGGEALQSAGINDQSQLSKVVPGLVIGNQGGTGIFFIRGIGQTQGASNSQPAIAINLNGVYWAREMGVTPLFDLERVEVLPGPQGTLWGRNAAGGAINFVTRRPTQDFGGEVTAEVGDYNLRHVTGVLNVPVTESFALRAAGDVNKHDGYMSNGAFDRDDQAYRVSGLYDGGGRFKAHILGLWQKNGGIGGQSVLFNAAGLPGPFNPNPKDPYNQTFSTAILYQDAVTRTVQAEFTYDLGHDVTLTYMPAYVDFEVDKVQQFQGNNPSRFQNSVDQKTHELRLANGADSRLQWVAGLYSHRAKHVFFNTVGVDRPTPVGVSSLTNNLRSWAAFGQMTYNINDTLRLTFGGRYSKDRFAGSAYGTTPPRSAANPLVGAADVTHDNVDGKIGLEKDLREGDTLLYATVQTGYLMGGFVQDGGVFKPETLIAYTAGSKNKFLDGRLQANLEVFYYDYQDYQLTWVQGTTFAAENAPTKVLGAQLDLALAPTDHDVLTLNATFQKAEILDRRLFPRNGVASSVYGYELPNAPDATITAAWEHKWSLPGGATLAGRVQSYYSQGYWMVFTHDLNTRQKAYTNSDVSLTYRSADKGWSLSAWGRNLEDEAVYIGANKPAPNASTAPYLNAPRTYGATLKLSF